MKIPIADDDPVSRWGEHTVEELLHQVDSAMYAAKAAGRNRISFTEPDGSSETGQAAPAEAIQSSSWDKFSRPAIPCCVISGVLIFSLQLRHHLAHRRAGTGSALLTPHFQALARILDIRKKVRIFEG
jgi:hypothetical protein